MVLLIVTGVSLVVTAVAAVLAWQMHRRETERGHARVAALASAIDDDAFSAGSWVSVEALDEHTAPRSAAVAPLAGDAPHPPMFSTAEHQESASGRQVTPILAVAAFAALVVIGTALWTASGATEVATAARTPPLELLSLRHDQDERGLAISGLVRNPAGAQPLKRLTAVVLVFDQQGSFLASSRSPIDFTTLAPGEESPFTVTLAPAPTAAGRYRVSFRRDDIGIVPHLDRRLD